MKNTLKSAGLLLHIALASHICVLADLGHLPLGRGFAKAAVDGAILLLDQLNHFSRTSYTGVADAGLV